VFLNRRPLRSGALRGEGRSTDALVLTVTLEFPMLINDGRASGAVVGTISYALDTDPVPPAILRCAVKLLRTTASRSTGPVPEPSERQWRGSVRARFGGATDGLRPLGGRSGFARVIPPAALSPRRAGDGGRSPAFEHHDEAGVAV
jgi:hypothetical protein